jgi:hypothetical protein
LTRLPNATTITYSSNRTPPTPFPDFSNDRLLSTLTISNESFTGAIPTYLGQMPQITSLILSSLPLTGPIPPQLFAGDKLRTLRISSLPNLNATLPPFFSNCSLYVMQMWASSLRGSLPRTISNCRGLNSVDLRDNNLAGLLPREFMMIPSMYTAYLTGNKFEGLEPPLSPDNRHLAPGEIYLDNNNLSGPMSESTLSALVYSGVNWFVFKRNFSHHRHRACHSRPMFAPGI